ncbi:hypothetical protein [Rhizobium hainanense]|uniref:Uncharacterized protein n=1 Tax=Rhizobium hainanense TaxID=52131 RepID=A0A1C3UXV5_9HYPH|nr:hypothetical protein [Rhizobium hainanense]SCB20254.1 hypothetical protein GA0061100_103489 [Rhizobium hainanense]
MKERIGGNDLAIFGLGIFASAPFIVVLLIGVQIAPDSFSPLKFSTSDFATLTAGIIGATIGGAISWMLARQASVETLARDSAARLDDHKSKALAILLKAQLITNGFYTNREYIRAALVKANRDGNLALEMWLIVQQRVGSFLSPIELNAAEFIPLMLAGKAALINECTLMALRFDVIEQSIDTYNNRREELQQMMLKYSTLDRSTGLVITEIPREERSPYEIKAKEIEELIQTIYRTAKEDYIRSKKLCADLSSTFHGYFGDSVFARLDDVEIDPHKRAVS